MGMLRYYTDKTMVGRKTRSSGVAEVAKKIYATWYHDNIPCISHCALRTKLGKLLDLIQEGHHRYQEQVKQGKGEWKVVTDYKQLVHNKDQLFDIFPKNKNGEDDMERKKEVELFWRVPMGKMEFTY